MTKTSDKSTMKNILQDTQLVVSQNVTVIKNKESLSNC